MNLPKEQIPTKTHDACRCLDHASNSDASKISRGFHPAGLFLAGGLYAAHTHLPGVADVTLISGQHRRGKGQEGSLLLPLLMVPRFPRGFSPRRSEVPPTAPARLLHGNGAVWQ